MVIVSASAVLVGTAPMVLVTLQAAGAACMDCGPPPAPPVATAADQELLFEGAMWRVTGIDVNGEIMPWVVALGARWVAVLERTDRMEGHNRVTETVGCPYCTVEVGEAVRYHEGDVVLRLSKGPRRQDTARIRWAGKWVRA